ncbi:MAG: J domain-containing protein [Hylemonella sp.]|nr:J domain-containing protein [Hylemonella sp.]
MKHENTLYEVLGLSPRASTEVIRAAYRCLAQHHHPDKNAGAAVANDRQALMNRAYAVLSDPHQRDVYDLRIGLNHSFFDRRGVPLATPRNGASGVAGQTMSRPFAFRPL